MAEGRAGKKSSSSSKGKPGLKENRATQFLTLLLLAGCCFASVFLYLGTTKLVQGAYSTPPTVSTAADANTAAESKEVQDTQDAVASLGRASSQVAQSAMLAEISGRKPFGTPASLVASQGGASAALSGVIIEEEQPPTVKVVAVMIKGTDRIAMIDVDGEEGGLVVRQGSKFSEGKARITQINPEGVKFTWMKKNYEVSMPR